MKTFVDRHMALFQSSHELQYALKELRQRSDNMIEASTIISNDGLIKAQLFQIDIDPHRIGAICASLFSLAKRAAADAARGELKLVLLEGSEGTVIVVQAGNEAVLAAIAKPKAQIGRMLLEVRQTAELVKKYI
ncbi:MAG: roadblock/LC7 domain-containing protein [Cocleimonas sp.]|nr:roadblock/LC7 domain-containing protein [Cocleimonas sp.]